MCSNLFSQHCTVLHPTCQNGIIFCKWVVDCIVADIGCLISISESMIMGCLNITDIFDFHKNWSFSEGRYLDFEIEFDVEFFFYVNFDVGVDVAGRPILSAASSSPPPSENGGKTFVPMPVPAVPGL